MRRIDTAAMDDDEVRLAQQGVVERRFKQERVGPSRPIEVPGSMERMYVDRHPEPARLARDVPEEEILQCLVVDMRWLAAPGMLRVDRACGRRGDLFEV